MYLIPLMVVWSASRCVQTAEPSAKFTYNSSDLSYLSNGIQFPANEGDVDAPAGDNSSENGSQFQWFSRLYDHHKWRNRLDGLDNPLCKSDMMVYLRELANDTSWAVKMYDASGRYSGQFFFGNDYWLGSLSLCKELTLAEYNTDVPPFPVQFYVAKVRVNLDRKSTPVTRQLNVGECLPKSCGTSEVRSLLVRERSRATSMSIAGVRKVPGDYSLLGDRHFHLVGGCSILLLGLILISTVVDYFKPRIRSADGDCRRLQNNNSIKFISTIGQPNGNSTIPDSKKKTDDGSGLFLKLLLCFSAINNGKKILSMDVALESIKCVHGLRFFSIAWIILVHSYLELFAVADNKNVRIVTERGFLYQTISNATFSVDTFFFISGLLVTVSYFRSESKKNKPPETEPFLITIKRNISSFFMMISYRFFRLTPAYLFVLAVNEIIMRYLHSNSVFSPAIIDHISCDQYWWRNVLYVNNFFPQQEFCMLWSWYMANDTQFYVIATAMLLIGAKSSRHAKFVALMIALLMGASWVTTFVVAMKWEYVARVEEPFALFDQLYDKPWLRIGPYLVGICAGYFLFKMDSKIKISRATNALGWFLALGCLGVLVYGLGRSGLTVPTSAFYAAFGHSAWGLAIAWLTVACCSGYGGPLNAFLSSKLFLPLSRLTYCAYLVHPVLMCLISFHLDGSFHLHQSMAIVVYFGNLVLSFLTAFVISLAFEAPVVNLLKIIFT